MIGFGSILILILSLSNLGTAILAANISKEAVIVDGRFVTNDGSAKTISTMNTVESVTKTWELHQHSRNLAEDGADTTTTDTTASQFTCFTQEEVDTIFETSISGSGTNLIMQSVEDDGSISQTVVSIHGTGHSSRRGVSFPDSNVELVLDDTGLCKESRRNLKDGSDEAEEFKMNVYVYRYRKTMQLYCESAVKKFTALLDCPASDPSEVGNGVCNIVHNTKECGFDGGDCDFYNSLVLNGCDVNKPHYLGNGECANFAPYNTEACGWDGGDCVYFNSLVLNDCPVRFPNSIGNGVCAIEYNTEACGWDGGDCDLYNSLVGCTVSSPNILGNDICENYAPYNTEACGWDGGDCDYINSLVSKGCTVSTLSSIGDGNCRNYAGYNTEACEWDGGDCDFYNSLVGCTVSSPRVLGNGICQNYAPYNTEACAWDGGDCPTPTSP
jgi:hypothetical protein